MLNNISITYAEHSQDILEVAVKLIKSGSRCAGVGFGYKQHTGRGGLDNKDSVIELPYRKIHVSWSKYSNVKETGEKSIYKKEVGKECTDGREALSKIPETKESWRKYSNDTI